MPWNLGPGELMVIALVVLLLFGAKRIPEVAASMGKGIREFKRNLSEVDRSLREPAADERGERAERLRSPEPAPRSDDPGSEPKRLIG